MRGGFDSNMSTGLVWCIETTGSKAAPMFNQTTTFRPSRRYLSGFLWSSNIEHAWHNIPPLGSRALLVNVSLSDEANMVIGSCTHGPLH
jgi:hypothetical protein